MLSTLRRPDLNAEEGHAIPLIGAIVAAVGPFVYDYLRHTKIDYEFFRRTTPK